MEFHRQEEPLCSSAVCDFSDAHKIQFIWLCVNERGCLDRGCTGSNDRISWRVKFSGCFQCRQIQRHCWCSGAGVRADGTVHGGGIPALPHVFVCSSLQICFTARWRQSLRLSGPSVFRYSSSVLSLLQFLFLLLALACGMNTGSLKVHRTLCPISDDKTGPHWKEFLQVQGLFSPAFHL